MTNTFVTLVDFELVFKSCPKMFIRLKYSDFGIFADLHCKK